MCAPVPKFLFMQILQLHKRTHAGCAFEHFLTSFSLKAGLSRRTVSRHQSNLGDSVCVQTALPHLVRYLSQSTLNFPKTIEDPSPYEFTSGSGGC